MYSSLSPLCTIIIRLRVYLFFQKCQFQKRSCTFLKVLKGLERSGTRIAFICPSFVKNARPGAEWWRKTKNLNDWKSNDYKIQCELKRKPRRFWEILGNVGKCWIIVGICWDMFRRFWEDFWKMLESSRKFWENIGKPWKTRKTMENQWKPKKTTKNLQKPYFSLFFFIFRWWHVMSFFWVPVCLSAACPCSVPSCLSSFGLSVSHYTLAYFAWEPQGYRKGYAKKLIVVNLFNFFRNFEIPFFSFFLEILTPERFKKLREACRIHFHLVAPLKTVMVTSYDQKTRMLTIKKSTTINMWA